MNILIVEDEPSQSVKFSRLLEKEGHTVVPAMNDNDAIAALNVMILDVAVIDYALGAADGREVAKIAVQKCPTVLMSAASDEDWDEMEELVKLEGMTKIALLKKPVRLADLLDAIGRAKAAWSCTRCDEVT